MLMQEIDISSSYKGSKKKKIRIHFISPKNLPVRLFAESESERN